MPPPLLQLTTIQDLLRWFRLNLCEAALYDQRHFRVRFLPTDFIHLIQMKTSYGVEPKNKQQTLRDIESGRIHFVKGRYDEQRASELSWATEIIASHDHVLPNWQALGRGDEVYHKNFGQDGIEIHRMMVCKVIGTMRQVITLFPRERLGERELRGRIWP
jgi:hypothetical protein